MLPMRHHLAKLTHTSTLRLYRLPRASQLLCRLSPEWYVPSQGNHCLVVALPPPVPGQGNLHPTALEALAVWVPSDGPRVNITAITPWEVPNWASCLGYMGTGQPHKRKTWSRALWDHCLGLSIQIIHVAGAAQRVTCPDTIVGGAAATFRNGGGEREVLMWPLGQGLLQFDVDAFALACAAEALAMYYTDVVPPPSTIYICSPSSSALLAVKNPRSTSASAAALMFHQSLTTLTLQHPDLLYILVWTPLDEELDRQQKAQEWALEASRMDPPDGSNHVQSMAFQKARARETAFLKWLLDWYFQHAHNTLNINAGGGPLNGHTHTFTITAPPQRPQPPTMDSRHRLSPRRAGPENPYQTIIHTPYHIHCSPTSCQPCFHRIICKMIPTHRPTRITCMPMWLQPLHTHPHHHPLHTSHVTTDQHHHYWHTPPSLLHQTLHYEERGRMPAQLHTTHGSGYPP